MALIRDREVLSDKINLYRICAKKKFTEMKQSNNNASRNAEL